MRLFLFISVIVFYSGVLQSQTNSFEIKGSITDQTTGEPIENVNIQLDDGKKGTTSNGLGEFQIRMNQLPFTIKISHINYKNTWITYEFIPMQDLNITLSPKTEQLPEITIQSDKINIVYKDEEYSVLDYELAEQGILLLIFENRISRSELLFIDFDGKTLSNLKVLPMKPLMLYNDCLDNVNIISKDYVRQIHFDSTKIKLYKPVKLSHYKSIMGNCRFLVRDKLYFEENSYYDLISTYFYVDTLDKTRHLLSTTGDDSKMDFLKNNPENLGYINVADLNGDMEGLRGLPSDFEKLETARNNSVQLRFNKMAYYDAIYAPLFQMGDSILIFNHPKDRIEIFSTNDSLISFTPVNYHKKEKKTELGTFMYAFAKRKKWLKKVYIDEEQQTAYTMFQNISGTYDLKEINLKTGQLIHKLTIPFPYVQKLKVNDGNLYFVYKGWGSNQQKKLYRQKIN